MARYNLFKGKSRGSIGDVTFSTQNGIQISRVRNRHPRNPRTNAQMFQRAIWATIIRIYSYGKAIFSTSFESAATPKQAMTAFMSANLDFLRELVITEIDNNTPADQQRGRVVHPQSYTPVPIDGLIVSQGTLTDTIFTVTPAKEDNTLQVSMPAPASATETLTQYAKRIGLTEEITYTIMANIVDKDINILYPVKINSPYAINYQSYFGAVRLTLKHLLSEKPISQATLADLFDIVRIGNTFTPSFGDIAFGQGTWNAETLLRNNIVMGTLAISAYNTTTNQVSNSAMNWIRLQNTYGIISEYAIQVWGKDEQTTNKVYIPEEPKTYDYEVEYLETKVNAGFAYIDTGIILNGNDSELHIKYEILTNYIGTIIYNNTTPASQNVRTQKYNIEVITNNEQGICYGTNNNSNNANYTLFDNEYNKIYDIHIYGKDKYATVNNNRINLVNGTIYTNTQSLKLFSNIASGIRIYNTKLISQSNVILDLIPVVKNGVGFMYDKISDSLLGSENNAYFIIGPKV